MYVVPSTAAPSIRPDSVMEPALSPKGEYPYLYDKSTTFGVQQRERTMASAPAEPTPSPWNAGDDGRRIKQQSSSSGAARNTIHGRAMDSSYQLSQRPVSISRPSASTATTTGLSFLQGKRTPDDMHQSPARSIATPSPLDQFKIANAAIGHLRSYNTPVVSNKQQHRQRPSSESPLRSTTRTSAPSTAAGPAAFNLVPAPGAAPAGRQREQQARSSTVPRRRPDNDAHQQKPDQEGSRDRFSALVEERRQQYDQRTRGRSPGPRDQQQHSNQHQTRHQHHPVDSATEYYKKAGLAGPLAGATPALANASISAGAGHQPAAPRSQPPNRSLELRSQSSKQDPATASFKKDPGSVVPMKQPHPRWNPLPSETSRKQDPQAHSPSITVRGPKFAQPEEMCQTAARYENSTIHKMLSEKRPTSCKPAESTNPPEDLKKPTETAKPKARLVNDTAARAASPFANKSTSSNAIRSYGFAERLSSQLARTDADRKTSIGSATATSVATPTQTAHPIFGYPKPYNKEATPRTQVIEPKQSITRSAPKETKTQVIGARNVIQNAGPKSIHDASSKAPTNRKRDESEVFGTNTQPVFRVQKSSSNTPSKTVNPTTPSQVPQTHHNDTNVDNSEESDTSYVRRSKHLVRVMRPASSTLIPSPSPTKRKVNDTAVLRVQHLQQQQHHQNHQQHQPLQHHPSFSYNEVVYEHLRLQQRQQNQTIPYHQQLQYNPGLPYNEEDMYEPATSKRVRAVETCNSPHRRMDNEYQDKDYSGGRLQPQTSSQQGRKDAFSVGQNRREESQRHHHHRPRHTNFRHYTDYNRMSPQTQYSHPIHNLDYQQGDAHLTQRLDRSIRRAQDDIDPYFYHDFVNEAGYIGTSDELQNDEEEEISYDKVEASDKYNNAAHFHQDLERRQPKSVSNREPGGVYGTDDVSSFMRVVEPPGAIDPPNSQRVPTKASKEVKTSSRSAANIGDQTPASQQYESFQSLEEKRKIDAPSGRSFLGPQSSTETGSGITSVLDSDSAKGDPALVERSQNERALEDLVHEKVKRMGKYHAEAMDESSDSRADAFMWLHQKYGTKAPTVNMKAIEKAKARALNAKADGNGVKGEAESEPIVEEEEDVFSGLDDMSSCSRKESPIQVPRSETPQHRVAKSSKITVRNASKKIETPKDDKQSIKTFQDALFSNTIISDLTMSLTTEKQKRQLRSTPKPITTYTGIEEVPSNDDSSVASENGCKRTTSAVADFGQTIGKTIVASLQRASCNLPEKIPVPDCTVPKARCEERINEAWGAAKEDEKDESLMSAGDNSTVTETMLNEMEKRIWAAWDRRRARPARDDIAPVAKSADESGDDTTAVAKSVDESGVGSNDDTGLAKSVDESGALHVDTASTASSENNEDSHHERSEAKTKLLQFAKKAVNLYGSQFQNTATLATLHSIDSSTHRPNPIVSVAAGTPVSKLSTTMTFEDQAMLENFSSALKNTGVEVLKLGRKNKWQVRYLTVSKEVTKLSTGGVAGDIGQCPMALLWPKSFKGHNFSVATIKENGRGGVLFKHLKKVRPTASNEYYDHHLPKKLKVAFPEFAGVVLDYLHDSGARQLHLCFKSTAESQAFITAMLIIREATERSEGDESVLDPASLSYATNSIAESEQ